jgi:hypothetical protein
MLDRYSECRGSNLFLVPIRIAMTNVLVGSQDLDERVAKSRRILV